MRASASCQQLVAEPVTLAAEGEDRVPRHRALLALGIDRDQRAVRRSRWCVDAADREREVQAGGAADRVGVPGIVVAAGQHRGGVRGGGDANRRAEVAEVPRGLQEHDRAGSRERVREVEARAARDAHDFVAREARGRGERAEAAGEIGRERRGERLEALRVTGLDLEDLGAEAQRVLERVESLDPGPRASGSSVGRGRGTVAGVRLVARRGAAAPQHPVEGGGGRRRRVRVDEQLDGVQRRRADLDLLARVVLEQRAGVDAPRRDRRRTRARRRSAARAGRGCRRTASGGRGRSRARCPPAPGRRPRSGRA